MKLATKTRYAVRALFDIAYHGRGRTTQARDIARRQAVPLRYLEQIFQDLKRAKLVEGKRGPHGGYSLGRAPEAITIGEIVRAMQGPIIWTGEDGEPEQSDPPTSLWRELREKVDRCFDDVRMSDLVSRGERIGLHRGDPQSHMYFI
jgi:Rrf2 family iron-sulfur cluster assembly transcriptional regulator